MTTIKVTEVKIGEMPKSSFSGNIQASEQIVSGGKFSEDEGIAVEKIMTVLFLCLKLILEA